VRRALRAGAALLAVAAMLLLPAAAMGASAPSQKPAPKTTLPDVEDEVISLAFEKVAGEDVMRDILRKGANLRAVFKEHGIL